MDQDYFGIIACCMYILSYLLLSFDGTGIFSFFLVFLRFSFGNISTLYVLAFECGVGSICDSSSGSCLGLCLTDKECQSGEHCIAGLCTPTCTLSSYCPPSYVCKLGLCTPTCSVSVCMLLFIAALLIISLTIVVILQICLLEL